MGYAPPMESVPPVNPFTLLLVGFIGLLLGWLVFFPIPG